MVFPVVMYGYERWTLKKAEHQRIDAFELWCWRKLLRVPWTARRSNQSILRRSNQSILRRSVLSVPWKDWCCSWNSNILATWCEELTHFKRPRCWERLGAEGEGGDRGWDYWVASLTQWTWVCVNSGFGDGQGSLACCSPWSHKESDTTEQLNWTELNTNWIKEAIFMIIMRCTLNKHTDIKIQQR